MMRTAWILFAGILNLNTATLAELDRLPGIGPVIAGRILDFREKRGGFRRVEELLAIQGVSERIWLELRPQLRVDSLDPDSTPPPEGEPGSGTGSEDAGQRSSDAADGPAEKGIR